MTILDGDRAAVVVELLDLLIVIAVGKDGLLMRIIDTQNVTVSVPIVLTDLDNTIGFSAACGVVKVGKSIPACIFRLRQKMIAGVGEAGGGKQGGRDADQFVSTIGIAFCCEGRSACSKEGNAAEHCPAVIELILPPSAIRDAGDLLARGIRNSNAADSGLIIVDFCQAAVGVKVALVSILVSNAVLGRAAAGGGQG